MEMISMLSGRWLEIVTAVYLIGMVLYGYYKGFIRMAVSIAALFITLFTVRLATPYLTEWLKNDTPIYETMKQGMTDAIGLEDIIAEKSQERTVIEGLELPEQLKKLLVENNNGEVYRVLGVEKFQDYVVGYLADNVIRLAVFVILFAAVSILIHVVVTWLDLIARLPILSGINKIAGAALGAAEGLVFVWVVCLVFTMLSGTSIGSTMLARVNTSPWLSWLYNHNMLSYFVIGLIRNVL